MRENVPQRNANLMQGRAALTTGDSSPPAIRLLEAQRSVTQTFLQLGVAQRLLEQGLLAREDHNQRVLAHAVAERKLNNLLRWLHETK